MVVAKYIRIASDDDILLLDGLSNNDWMLSLTRGADTESCLNNG